MGLPEHSRQPFFWVGLAIRIALLIGVVPQAAQDWYLPFLTNSIAHFSLDPWSNFLVAGGDPRAFPYGFAMWLAFLPLAGLSMLLHAPIYCGYALTLLFFDFALLCLLKHFAIVRSSILFALYWCSPIIIFATYWLGLNDLIPATLLCAGLLCLRRQSPIWAGTFAGLAVSAKLSMVVPLPVIAFFLFRNPANHPLIKPFISGFLIVALLLGLPFVFSPAALQMLVSNPEMQKIYDLRFSLGADIEIFVLPVVYLLVLFAVWRIGRMSFDLLLSTLAVTFFLVLLLTPAAPGWFVWVLPFLVIYEIQSGRRAVFLVAGFSLLYLISIAINTAWPIPFQSLQVELIAKLLLHSSQLVKARGILQAILLAFGIVLSWRIWQEAVAANEYFRINRRPLVLGIAGDSGAGKDSLANAITELFGSHSVVSLSGDDYHLWDRGRPMWQVMTHLNPRANNLAKFAQDLLALTGGQSIINQHYDHNTGLRNKPHRVRSNHVILASGLHALYLPILRDCYDLKIYLDIDEDLRRYFKLQRDVNERGHHVDKVLASIERREEDAQRFVRRQRSHADLVLALQPIHPRILTNSEDKNPPRLKLSVNAGPGLLDEDLLRVLIGVCGLHVDMSLADNGKVDMTIEGETSADDIALAARHLMPQIHELLDLRPRWQDGVMGLMQLLVIAHIHQALRKRLV